MLIKLKADMHGPFGSYTCNQQIDVDQAVAEIYIRDGYAVPVIVAHSVEIETATIEPDEKAVIEPAAKKRGRHKLTKRG